MIYCTCGHLLVESESSQNLNNWRLDALSIPHCVIKKGRPHGARHVSKEITKELTIVSNETQYIVIRNSKLAGPRRSASKWISWHRKTTPTVYPERSIWNIKNTGSSHQTNRARMHRCDFDQISEPQSQSWTVSTENQEKNVQNLLLFNYIRDGTLLPQVTHRGIGTRPKAGGAHEFYSFLICCSSFRLQLMAICCNRRGCEQHASHVTFSRWVTMTHMAQGSSQKSICKNGETCQEWATIRFAYSGNRQRCLVWLRKHQCKHGETCEQLRASVCWTFVKNNDADENVDAD